MAKQYVYKLNKGADYFINQKWLTDTFMIINRYLLTTNSELLNDRLKTNEKQAQEECLNLRICIEEGIV